MSQRDIAYKAATTPSQINRIKNQQQIPNYYLGNSLIFLTEIVPNTE